MSFEYIEKLDNVYFKSEKDDNNETKTHLIIDDLFKVFLEYIENDFLSTYGSKNKSEKIVLVSARERIGFHDGLMKGIYIHCNNSSLKKKMEKKISQPLEITQTYFTQENSKDKKKSAYQYFKSLLVKNVDGVYKVDRSASIIEKSFRTRIESFLKGVDTKEITIKSVLVFGRNFSRIRYKNSNLKKNNDEFIDQIFVIYLNYDIKKIKPDKIDTLTSFLKEIFRRIDSLRVQSLLELERNLREIISCRLPLAVKKEESPARTIKKINKDLVEQLEIYFDDVYGKHEVKENIKEKYGSFEHHNIVSTFIHVGYQAEENTTTGFVYPEFRVFPESCGISSTDILVKQQYILRSKKSNSLSKYFIYLFSESLDNKSNFKCSNEFKRKYSHQVDNTIEKKRISQIKNQLDESKKYLKYSESSVNHNEVETPWIFNQSIFDGNEGSFLLFSFNLGRKEKSDKLSDAINSILVFESKNPYLFDDEITACIEKIIPLYASILEILPLALTYIDYEDALREIYYSNYSLIESEGIREESNYTFEYLAFDLFRTNLVCMEKDFIQFCKVSYADIKEKDAEKYISNVYSKIKDGNDRSIIFNASYYKAISDFYTSMPDKDKKGSKKENFIYHKSNINNIFEQNSQTSVDLFLDKSPDSDPVDFLRGLYKNLQIGKRDHVTTYLLSNSNARTAVTDAINEVESGKEYLANLFIEFMKTTHSCVVWSSWIGAIRMILKKRFDVSNFEELRIQQIDTGFSALEMLVVHTDNESIKQVIKLGEKEKLEREVRAYDNFIRYQITDAARIPSDGFCYLCDGNGIFEFGSLLSDLVGFTEKEEKNESTLFSLLTPIKMEHTPDHQIPFNKFDVIIKKLFVNSLERWKEVTFEDKKEDTLSNIIKDSFRISDFERKTGTSFESIEKWENLVMFNGQIQYKSDTVYKSLDDIFDHIGKTSERGQDFSSSKFMFKTIKAFSLNLKINTDNGDIVFPCDSSIIHGDLTFFNVLMAGSEEPERPVLIDFEHVKKGFQGADQILLLFNSFSNYMGLSGFLDVTDSILEKNTLEKGISLSPFCLQVKSVLNSIDSFIDAVGGLFKTSTTQLDSTIDKIHTDVFDKLSENVEESWDKKTFEEIEEYLVENKFLTKSEIEGIRETYNNKNTEYRIILTVLVSANHDVFRRKLFSTALIDNICDLILPIYKGKGNKKLITKFWYYAFFAAALVQMVYSIINLIQIHPKIYGEKDWEKIFKKSITDMIVSLDEKFSHKGQEINLSLFLEKIRKNANINETKPGNRQIKMLLTAWMSMYISMYLTNKILYKILKP